MNHSRLWILATIIALAIMLGFVVSVPHTRDIATAPLENIVQVAPVVSLNDSFRKGLHTISGSLTVPNACTFVTARPVLTNNASSTDGILVELSFPVDTGVCLQVHTRTNFSTTLNAPARLPISVMVNGVVATVAP